jgi:hypothetical protein
MWNLGSTSGAGNNALSVKRGGFALDDARIGTQFLDRYILAVGTTLNGVSFDGQTLEGPAELAPYYRIIHPDSRAPVLSHPGAATTDVAMRDQLCAEAA